VTHSPPLLALPLQLVQGVILPRVHHRHQQLLLPPLLSFPALFARAQSLT